MSVRPNGACSISVAKSTAQNTPWTRLFWIYNGNVGAYSYSSLCSDDDSGLNYIQISADSSPTSEGNYILYIRDNAISVDDIPAGSWVCFALVSDGSNITAWRGVFGSTLVAVSPTLTLTSVAATSVVYYLNSGYNEPASNEWSLGPAREWSAALTSGELAAEMNRLTPARTSNLIYSYYNRTVGEAGTDFSGNSANGTITGVLQTGAAEPLWYDQNITLQSSTLYTGFSPSFSHTLVTPSGNGRMVFVIINRVGSGIQNFSGLTFNSATAEVGPVVSAVSFSNRHTTGSFWVLDSALPIPGSYNVSWSFTGAGSLYGWQAEVLEFTGVNQTTPVAATASQFTDSTSLTSYSTNITTTTANCMLLDFTSANDSASGGTPGAGQTEANDSYANGCAFFVSRKIVPTAQASSMSWTFGTASAVSQAILEIVNITSTVTTSAFNAIFFGMHF